ncbi:MAG: cytochrome c oxidase subunit II [Sterolibacteriaceae bacterium]|uniref:Cytochrome c oxidase subunit 2 n=1 Tax=Candidatus Methylophosphatis roskildensis TaxID=2899263 RepID=A0A9D7HSW7_9PROT|nr:cytochrome c oxidase subunit II [Candidatus Methylophosphatis roskildensis]MBK7238504.1 cytochrome c oxidase subunit II [Sterolibacteriaceae bacterium]
MTVGRLIRRIAAPFGTSVAASLGAGGLFLASSAYATDSRYNLQTPVTQIAQQVYDLHTIMMVVCLVIFVAVFGVMFYSIYAHRKSKGAVAAQWHENTTVEVLWTIIPVFILLGMAWPATKTVLAMKDTSNSDITIKATGYQWKWGYDYLKGEGEGIRLVSNLSTPRDQIDGGKQSERSQSSYLLEVDDPLVVPVGKKIRILTTANDVIHAWWVPAFAVKQDAIPGFIRDTWFRADKEGIYRGNCAELCGKDHGFMPIEVHVVSAEKYATWVAERKKVAAAVAEDPSKKYTLAELKAKGQKAYDANCVACHQASGKGLAPAFPALDGSKIATGPIAEHVGIVLNGKAGTAMAAWKQLSDTEIAAVVTFERNNWGNAVGDMVQPSDIKAARGGAQLAASPMPALAKEAPTESATTAASDALPAKLYFRVGKAALPADAMDAVKAVAEFLAAKPEAKVDITGYTDQSGSLDKNLELAKERAKAVRDALAGAGIAEDRIHMKKPEAVTGGGDNREARRVEINPAS